MSLILDALNRARQLAQGRNASPQAQNLMNSFGFSQRAKRKRTKKLVLYIVPALILAAGIAYGANLWLKRISQSSITVNNRDATPADAGATTSEPPAPPAEDQTTETTASEVAETNSDPAPPAASEPPAAPPKSAPAPTPPRTAASTPRQPVSSPPASRDTTTPAADRTQTAAAPTPAVNSPASSATPVATPAAPPTPAAPLVASASTPDPHDAMVAYYQTRNYPKALEECKKALDKWPNNAGTYGVCGAVYYRLNRLEEALDMLTQSIRISESTRTQGSAMVFNILGSVYMDKGDNSGALGAFEKATLIDAKHAPAFYNMGLIHKKTRSLNAAKENFRKVTQLEPLNKDAQWNLALIYDEQGETGSALVTFREFRRLAVGHPDYKSDVEHAETRIKELESKIPKPD